MHDVERKNHVGIKKKPSDVKLKKHVAERNASMLRSEKQLRLNSKKRPQTASAK